MLFTLLNVPKLPLGTLVMSQQGVGVGVEFTTQHKRFHFKAFENIKN